MLKCIAAEVCTPKIGAGMFDDHEQQRFPSSHMVLVDGSGYLFRAFYAMPALTSPSGKPTGAIYGVLNMLKRLEKTFPDATRAVVFDPKGKTHRHDWYPEYKANRSQMPEDLAEQIQPLIEAVDALGWPVCTCEGIEADDVMGTLAMRALQEGYHKITLCSGDKDFAQLVSEQLSVYDGMKERVFDRGGVKEKFGVWPEQIVDYLTLVGDSVDNVPGVEKVGPKTAVKWLDTHHTLDQLIEKKHTLKGKIAERFEAAIPMLATYKRLVTIQCDLDLPVSIASFLHKQADRKRLQEVYAEHGFKTWLKEIMQHDNAAKPMEKKRTYEVADTLASWQRVAKKMRNAKKIAWSAFGLLQDEMDKKGVMLCWDHTRVYVPLAPHADDASYVSMDDFFKAFSSHLSGLSDVVTMHGKAFWRMCIAFGYNYPGRVVDVGVKAYVEKGPGRLRLDQIAYDRLQMILPVRTEVFGQGAKQKTLETLTTHQVADALYDEVEALFALDDYFSKEVIRHPWQKDLYEEVDGPLMRVLADMEHRGVALDVASLDAQSQRAHTRIQALEQKAHDMAGEAFNLSSPKQLQALFYDKLGWPVLEKTPTGQPSTGESALAVLAREHALAKVILEYRGLSKLKSTYLDALPKCVNANTGRVHAHFSQTTTTTGRLACQNPNLQNIPIRTEDGKKVRQAFVPSPGYVLYALDYSQIELRIMAHIADDKALLSAFLDNKDVHASTASELYDCSVDAVTSDMRRVAKVINFGIIYGMSAFGLAKQLDISRELATSMIEKYFAKYPSIQTYMEKTREHARLYGYVETLLGRKMYLQDIRHGQQSVRRAQERAAINAPMQGTAAEIIKLAMLHASKVIEPYREKKQAFLILQVHDELVFEIHHSIVDEIKTRIEKAMQQVLRLKVPLSLSSGQGEHWGEAH